VVKVKKASKRLSTEAPSQTCLPIVPTAISLLKRGPKETESVQIVSLR